MAESMSASVGFGVLASSATADMICPDWQYPHCGTSSSIQAFCTGWLRSAERPSMVVTGCSPTALTGVTQERMGSPPRCTVQAPHSAMPQPYLVPVRPMVSRRTQSSIRVSSTVSRVALPLSVNDTTRISASSRAVAPRPRRHGEVIRRRRPDVNRHMIGARDSGFGIRDSGLGSAGRRAWVTEALSI